jgi:hypothetical protein
MAGDVPAGFGEAVGIDEERAAVAVVIAPGQQVGEGTDASLVGALAESGGLLLENGDVLASRARKESGNELVGREHKLCTGEKSVPWGEMGSGVFKLSSLDKRVKTCQTIFVRKGIINIAIRGWCGPNPREQSQSLCALWDQGRLGALKKIALSPYEKPLACSPSPMTSGF